jgi:hypothetical protein
MLHISYSAPVLLTRASGIAMLFNVESLLSGRNQAGIIIAVFLGYCIRRHFFVSKKRYGKCKNPFAHDARLPLTPLVTEQEKRDEILKKGWYNPVLYLNYLKTTNNIYYCSLHKKTRY